MKRNMTNLTVWIIAGLIPLSIFAQENPLIYEKPPEPLRVLKTTAPTGELANRLLYWAEIYDVSFEEMDAVINCESGWDTKIQSQHKYKGTDIQEKSFGLVQIHLPAHKTVTKKQAQDPDFAMEFMAKAFSQGNQDWWTCFNDIYK